MADEYRTADRSALKSGAEALQRLQEEISNLTFEDNADMRERLISLTNTVAEKFGEIGDRLTEGRDKDGVENVTGRDAAAEDAAKRDDAASRVEARKTQNRR